jgi:hypothetical protein
MGLVGPLLIGAAVLIAVVLMASTSGAAVERIDPSPPPEPVPLTGTDGSRLHWLMLGGLLALATLLLMVAVSVGVHDWLNRPCSERHARGSAGRAGADVADVDSFEDPRP